MKIRLIKDTTKREREGLRIERINKFTKIGQIKKIIEKLKIKIKFNESANNFYIRSI